MGAVGRYLADAGVDFVVGDAGTSKQPLLTADEEHCVDVETLDATKYYADKVVLDAEAWSPVLVDLEGQCVCKAWVYAYVQLTPSKAAAYKQAPIVYISDVGFFFEPDEHGVIKVYDEFPGFTRFKQCQPYGVAMLEQISVPRSHAKHPTDTYPDASEVMIRRAVSMFLLQFTDGKLFNRRLGWCTDTADAALLICEHPRWKSFFSWRRVIVGE